MTSADRDEFAQLPDGVRAEVHKLRAEFDAIAPPYRRAFISVADRLGLSVSSVRRKFYEYRAGGWRALINETKVPEMQRELPPEFVGFWQSLVIQNQRKSRPAYRHLLRIWSQRTQRVPGYEDFGGWPKVPRGWSPRNLYRYVPSKFAQSAARQGRCAAVAFRPTVNLTRVGCQVGQFYQFDDMWHDLLVGVPGQRRPQRPLAFHALDYLSGCLIALGAKPRLDVGDKTEILKESDFLFLLAHVLGSIGINPHAGTWLTVEHGMAAIREDLERELHDFSGGLIHVERSGIAKHSAHAGEFAPSPRGNPRMKAALESLHNLVHNDFASLPGQTGKDRQHSPEGLPGREKYHMALADASLLLPAERASQILWPFLTWEQFLRIASHLYDRINARTDHSIEGWEKAGFVFTEMRLGEVRCRKLSPLDVWLHGRRALQPVSASIVALILARCTGAERTLRNHEWVIEDAPHLGTGLHRFLPVLRQVDGTEVLLSDGATFRTVVSPYDQRLWLYDARGAFKGTCDRKAVPCRADEDGRRRAMGQASKIEAALLRPLARLSREQAAEKEAMHRHNASLLAAEPGDRRLQRKAAESALASMVDQFSGVEPNYDL